MLCIYSNYPEVHMIMISHAGYVPSGIKVDNLPFRRISCVSIMPHWRSIASRISTITQLIAEFYAYINCVCIL